ncbi:hypothetical protein [Lentzea sp. NPDC051838]|uniref:hypothetical protein n=1 Tax=Lentzea sp. NPDC051838 TaxID=3154849 RepID=UPI003420C5C3
MVTPDRLTRGAAVSAVASGALFILVQLIHPEEVVSEVTGPLWTVTHHLTMLMAVLGAIGVAGLYLRQIGETGLLGLIGCILLEFFFGVTLCYTFVETFVLPALAEKAPEFVTSLLVLPGGGEPVVDVGPVALVAPASFVLYLAGGLLLGLGISLWRTGVRPLPRTSREQPALPGTPPG